MKNEDKMEVLKASVINEIRNFASKSKPITADKLCSNFNITFRHLKQIITALREDYPIVAKETDGGGYWLAESENDIIEYINMINRRKRGYENTIKIMNRFLVDYDNIPTI